MQTSEIYNYVLLIAALVGAGAQAKKSHQTKEKGGVSTIFFLANGLNAVHGFVFFSQKKLDYATVAMLIAYLVFFLKNTIVYAIKKDKNYLYTAMFLLLIGFITLLVGNTLFGSINFFSISEFIATITVINEAYRVYAEKSAKGISIVTMAIYTISQATGLFVSHEEYGFIFFMTKVLGTISCLYIFVFKLSNKE